MPYAESGAAVGHWCFIDYPSGQLRTTAADMGKFLQALLNRGMLANGSRLFDEATAAAYFKCQTPSAATAASEEFESCPLAFQWFLDFDEIMDNIDGMTAEMVAGGLQHEGQVAGVDTLAAVMPGAGFAFAIMTNTEEGAASLLPTVLRHSLLVDATFTVSAAVSSLSKFAPFWSLALATNVALASVV
eukprot:TRINITY_DN82087_c0_g1_i1.p1 TRINITY_DN82087_c0_g1~~TRINITY_DN82087_c0_g1_i1.p1  ORF type:complete len:214 (+),score=38.27 TRINITY_DN82087_c0_g1_i1:81-644(+)